MEALVPGEPDTAELPEDVAHWLAVYRELLLHTAHISPSYATRLRLRLAHWERLAAEHAAG